MQRPFSALKCAGGLSGQMPPFSPLPQEAKLFPQVELSFWGDTCVDLEAAAASACC